MTITGAAVGERVCVTDSTGDVAILTGTGSPLTHLVDTTKKGADVTVSATTGPGSATDEIQVLGKARLKPRLAKSVSQGDKVVVKVKKLGAKEKVKIFVDGKLVAKGKATKKGVFVGRFVARLKVGSPPAQGRRPVQEPQRRKDLPGRRLTMRLLLLRLAAAVLATAAAGLGLVATASAPATAAACSGATGVTVVVDHGALGGGVDQVCNAGGGGKRRDLAVHGCGLLPDLRPAPARFRVPNQRPAGLRPVRQHAAVERLLGAVVVGRDSPGRGPTPRWAPGR